MRYVCRRPAQPALLRYRSSNIKNAPGRERLQGNHATTIRDRLHKRVCYYDRAAGELFESEVYPAELDNLRDDSATAEPRFELPQKNFAALARAVDVGFR